MGEQTISGKAGVSLCAPMFALLMAFGIVSGMLMILLRRKILLLPGADGNTFAYAAPSPGGTAKSKALSVDICKWRISVGDMGQIFGIGTAALTNLMQSLADLSFPVFQ